MGTSLLRKAMDARGLPFKTAYKATGLNSSTVSKHYRGLLAISAKDAILYEKALGIPRSELRPDFWPTNDYDFKETDKA